MTNPPAAPPLPLRRPRPKFEGNNLLGLAGTCSDSGPATEAALKGVSNITRSAETNPAVQSPSTPRGVTPVRGVAAADAHTSAWLGGLAAASESAGWMVLSSAFGSSAEE